MCRLAKIEQVEYAAGVMLNLMSLLQLESMPQKIPESIEKLVRR